MEVSQFCSGIDVDTTTLLGASIHRSHEARAFPIYVSSYMPRLHRFAVSFADNVVVFVFEQYLEIPSERRSTND